MTYTENRGLWKSKVVTAWPSPTATYFYPSQYLLTHSYKGNPVPSACAGYNSWPQRHTVVTVTLCYSWCWPQLHTVVTVTLCYSWCWPQLHTAVVVTLCQALVPVHTAADDKGMETWDPMAACKQHWSTALGPVVPAATWHPSSNDLF